MSSNSWVRSAHLIASIWPSTIRTCPKPQQQVRSLALRSHVLESSVVTGLKIMPSSSLPHSIAGQRTHTSYLYSTVCLEQRPKVCREDISRLISRKEDQASHESPTNHSTESQRRLRSESEAWKELKRRAITQWRDARAS